VTIDFTQVSHLDVLLALAEYDELGEAVFLDTYGFAPTGTSRLMHEGQSYDCEAILGVACKYATGEAATSEDLSGGRQGALTVLENLGFEIRTATPEPRDASVIGSAAALAAWADAARAVLLEAAGRYRALVTYKQLTTAVQQSTGITTTLPMHQWIGDVLARVTDECQARGEPLLSALCVTLQGSVGQVYADAVEQSRGTRPSDPDEHAAHERLQCYRYWEATGLPRDGGTPLRTAHFKTVRRTAESKPLPRASPPRRTPSPNPRPAAERPAPKPAPKPVPLCPRCFTQVPASGVCDYCD
jgi:hypothetical protein